VPIETSKVFSCSVKCAQKTSPEPVTVNIIEEPALKGLVKNPADKLRLINIWATWRGTLCYRIHRRFAGTIICYKMVGEQCCTSMSIRLNFISVPVSCAHSLTNRANDLIKGMLHGFGLMVELCTHDRFIVIPVYFSKMSNAQIGI
jgi:hypothetical protein